MQSNIPKLIFSGKSDLGLRRANNEDAFIVNAELGFFLVADGMGGAAAGELASHIFADAAQEVFSAPGGRSETDTPERVKRAFILANERILDHVEENKQHQGMACTAELIAFTPVSFVAGHMGDSRTYRFRNRRLKQLTRDHSLVQDQVEQGLINEAEARRSPYRNIILRAVGTEDQLALDLIKGKINPGDTFLLCTDGLTSMADDPLIEEVLCWNMPVPQKIERLVDLAKSAGGDDNITVVLVEIV